MNVTEKGKFSEIYIRKEVPTVNIKIFENTKILI